MSWWLLTLICNCCGVIAQQISLRQRHEHCSIFFPEGGGESALLCSETIGATREDDFQKL